MTGLALAALAGVLFGAALRAPSVARSASDNFTRVVLPVGQGPGSIAIADVNHDGHPDIIVANTGEGTVSVLLGDGRGNFRAAPGSPFPCNANPNDIAVADMNGDGNPDLVIANTGTPYITVLLGDGHGGFKPSTHSPFATTSYPHVHGVAVGDFFGDGKPAVVTDSWGRSQILLIPSDGQGSLILPGKTFRADLYSDSGVRAADFTHDGHLDVVTIEQTFGSRGRPSGVGLMLGDGKGGFRRAPGSPFPAGGEPWEFTVADMNHDGNPDVVVVPYQRDLLDPAQLSVTVLLGDGKGAFTKMKGSPFSLAGCRGPDRVATGDFNGDGYRDIAVACAQNNKVMLYWGSKGGTFRISSLDVETGWSGLAAADLTGDGKDDIIVSNYGPENGPENGPKHGTRPLAGTITIFMSK